MAGDRSREATRRLFFALWPNEASQAAFAHSVHKAAKTSGGRPVPADNLHVTLAFLGSVPERQLSQLQSIAGQVAQTFPVEWVPLRLRFERFEHWKKVQVLCALAEDVLTEAVGALAERLKTRLLAAGFTPDWRSSRPVTFSSAQRFRAHVTVARKVQHAARLTAMEPVTWSFTDFVLVDSKTLPQGSVYTVLERFTLGHPGESR